MFVLRCCIGGLCFGFIGTNTVPSTELRPRLVKVLLMLLSQALLLLCHLDNDLVLLVLASYYILHFNFNLYTVVIVL